MGGDIIEYLERYGAGATEVQVFLVVLLTLTVAWLQAGALRRLLDRVKRTRTLWDEAFVSALRRPLTVLIWLLGLGFAVDIIRAESDIALFDAVDPLREVAVIALLAWFLVRFIRDAELGIIRVRESSGEAYDRTTLDAVTKLLRLSVVITAALVTLQTLGFSVSGVLAFGGVGGIAVGFAAKDLLANFFGGLMVYLDRPFAVGDWIRSPDRDIEGTVERIGWRLTMIRRFDSRPLYVPNSTFTAIAVENPSRMSHRRLFETIGIRYDDAAQMEGVVRDVKRMLEEHPDIDSEKYLMVAFDRFAQSSLDFFVYTFTHTTNWARFHDVKQDVLLRIGRIIDSHGAEIAFPTRTLHLAPGALHEAAALHSGRSPSSGE